MNRLKCRGVGAVKVLALMSLLSVIGATSVHAQEEICRHARSNPEYKECLGLEYEKVDAKLNHVYKAAIASIETADHLPAKDRHEWKEQLRQAQRHWISFKEADCNQVVPYEWWRGTGAGSAVTQCLIGKTKTRMEELKTRYELR